MKKLKMNLTNTISSQNLQNQIQDAIDRFEHGKAKDSSGVRAEQLNNCSDSMKEKSERSSMKLLDKKTSHQEAGARSESRSSTRKVTVKMQTITGQFEAYQLPVL